jgi:putative oxidoreductase
MFTAIRTVHWRNGPWVTRGGYEYNLVLLGALAVLAEGGPGTLSLDALRGRERKGLVWAVGAIGAGALGSALALRWAQRHAPAQEDLATAAPIEHASPAERPASARPVERREPVGAV